MLIDLSTTHPAGKRRDSEVHKTDATKVIFFDEPWLWLCYRASQGLEVLFQLSTFSIDLNWMYLCGCFWVAGFFLILFILVFPFMSLCFSAFHRSLFDVWSNYRPHQIRNMCRPSVVGPAKEKKGSEWIFQHKSMWNRLLLNTVLHKN